MFAIPSVNSVALKTAKVLAGAAALFSIASGTVGCNSSDALVIGGTIAIVAGIAGSDDNDRYNRHHRDHRGHRGSPVCRTIVDRFGTRHTDCDRSDEFAASVGLASDSPFLASTKTDGVSQIASKYNLPLEAAEKLTATLRSAAAGKTDALALIGLSSDELARVAQYTLPSDAALDKIAASLALSHSMARGLVQQLINETQAQMADVDSPAWTACKATGKWKTDANGGTCKSTSWNGCSPANGASVCASVR